MTLNAPTSPSPAAANESEGSRGPGGCRSWIVALILILALAAVVRFSRLGQDDYWLDELHSFANSAGRRAEFESFRYGEIFRHPPRATDLDANSSLSATWHTMRHDSHPPVFFLILLEWRRLFGDGEFAVRFLSAGLSVLAIVPVALTLLTLERRRAALIAAIILAVSYAHIFVAQQDRPYSLALLLTSLSFWLLVLLERAGHVRPAPKVGLYCAYGLSVYLAVLTHYFAGLPLLAHVVYAASRFRGRTIRYWLATVLIASGAAAATWLPTFLHQIDFIRAQPWLIESGAHHGWATLLRLTDLPIRLLADVAAPMAPFKLRPLQSLGGAVALIACIWALRRRRWEPPAVLFLLWFAVPVLMLLLFDASLRTETLMHLRYPVIAVPGLAGIIGLTISRARPRAAIGLTAVLVLAILLLLDLPATHNPDARVAVRTIEAMRRPDDLLVFDAIDWPADWIPQFYAPIHYYLPDVPNPMLLLSKPMSEELRARVEQFPRIIVISPRIDAVPNPSPGTYEPVARSEYIFQVGWVYLFVKQP